MRVITYLLLLVPLFLFYSCYSEIGNCNEDSPAVIKAKNLSITELKGLLKEVDILLTKFTSLTLPQINELPDGIKSLSPQHVTSHGGKRLWIYLNACTPDSKVILHVDAERNDVTVQWGDWGSPKSGSLKLWPKT